MPPKRQHNGEPKAAVAPNSSVYAIVWTVSVSINDFGEETFTDCNADEGEGAMENERNNHEVHDNGQSDGVYLSKASALKAAQEKFVQLSGEHWQDDFEIDDDGVIHIDTTAEGDDADEIDNGPIGNPAMHKAGDKFAWERDWVETEMEHQMTSSIEVSLKQFNVLE